MARKEDCVMSLPQAHRGPKNDHLFVQPIRPFRDQIADVRKTRNEDKLTLYGFTTFRRDSTSLSGALVVKSIRTPAGAATAPAAPLVAPLPPPLKEPALAASIMDIRDCCDFEETLM